jgi:hypothetical protein
MSEDRRRGPTPTVAIRCRSRRTDTRSGYGVYVYGTDKKVHYFFVS